MFRTGSRHGKYAPLFDVDPVTGASIEVFYADRTLESFGRDGAGWFWWPRRRGLAPTGPARGPFPTGYSAYRDAIIHRPCQHTAQTTTAPTVNADTVRTSTFSG
jgi:hypothetical protein